MSTEAGDDGTDALFQVAEDSYRTGDWAKASILFQMLQARHPAAAAARGVPIAAGHCRIELSDDVDPTALAAELVPLVPGQAVFGRIGPIRLRVLALCRARNFARAMRLVFFLASFDQQIGLALSDGMVKGRSGCWETPDDAAEPGFLEADRRSDAAIAALKARFEGRRVLLILPWNEPYSMGDRHARSARAFGLVSRSLDLHQALGNLDPALMSARIQAELDAFRPDIVVCNSLVELGLEPAVVEPVSAVFEAARRKHGVRVVASMSDAWRIPADRITDGLGRSLDMIQHCHPALLQQRTFDARTVFCYVQPTVLPTPSVAAGTIPRAVACGSFTFANPSRLLWWARAGLSDLPFDFVETSVDGEGMLSAQRYADLLCEHQLTISLTRRLTGTTIVTGRSIEILLVGGVLLDENSFDSRYFLKPGTHYLPFETWADLAELIPWLLAHPEHRQRLARAGQAWAQRHFSGDWFWAGVLDRLYDARG